MTISVRLRPAGPDDRRSAWEWMCRSDVTPSMMGAPTFSDHAVPDFDDFCADWLPHFWSDSQPELGRALVIVAGGEEVGISAYNDICTHADGRNFTELHTWLRSEAHCGVGHGTQAMKSLCKFLRADLAVDEVSVQLSSRNQRSIRAHEKGWIRAGGCSSRRSRPQVPDLSRLSRFRVHAARLVILSAEEPGFVDRGTTIAARARRCQMSVSPRPSP